METSHAGAEASARTQERDMSKKKPDVSQAPGTGASQDDNGDPALPSNRLETSVTLRLREDPVIMGHTARHVEKGDYCPSHTTWLDPRNRRSIEILVQRSR